MFDLVHLYWGEINLWTKQVDSDKYLNYRRIYKSVLRESEATRYKTIFDRNKNNTKTIWRNTNKILKLSGKTSIVFSLAVIRIKNHLII